MSVLSHTLQEPSGELVGLDFYFGSLASADALEAVVRLCLESGGVCSNSIYVTEFKGARESKFESVYSAEVRQRHVSEATLFNCLLDSDQRVVRVPISGAIGISGDTADLVSFNGVSKLASLRDSHPVSIAAEGWMFSTPGYEQKAVKAGRRCYDRFLHYCQSLQPDYAAILNENSLPSACDLQGEKGNRCFYDFFVNAEVYGEHLVRHLEHMYQDAFLKRIGNGIFVSASSWYNPKGLKVSRLEALQRSVAVSKLLSGK